MRRVAAGYMMVAAVAALVSGAVEWHARSNTAILKAEFRASSSARAAEGVRIIDQSISGIYQNLRTLASLPALRDISRHAENLSPEARATFQLIYNNLASSVSVSEVYVVPASFDPERIDAATGRGEEPVIMFDELILNAGSKISPEQRALDPRSVRESVKLGPPEVEIHEYRQLATQISWFKANHPDLSRIKGLSVPLISGSEVITCDNTFFISSLSDDDRKGIIFSVPYFGADGRLAGVVSAIILTRALRDLLPSPDQALVNSANGVLIMSGGAGPHMLAARDAIAEANPDPTLLYSEVSALPTADARSPWTVWTGYDNQRFYGGPEYQSLQKLRWGGHGLALLLLIAGALCWHLIGRDMRKSRVAAIRLTRARDEAKALAQQFQSVNDDIARLNHELNDKVSALQVAQDEIVRKGRLAQLGQLTATVAHELRNPMGTVRTTAYLLKRKLKDRAVEFEPLLARIDSGIGRCDDIIAQLLDYARSKKPDISAVKIDDWIESVIGEEAQHLPEQVAIDCQLGTGGAAASFDPDRMRRALNNLMNNATEAMVGKPGAPPKTPTAAPMISIRSRITARGVEITVSDNGPGMAEEILDKVREPLFTTKNFGTGLGIPAVERILELHGGGLDIQSAPGKGASFTAWFPFVPAQAEAA